MDGIQSQELLECLGRIADELREINRHLQAFSEGTEVVQVNTA